MSARGRWWRATVLIISVHVERVSAGWLAGTEQLQTLRTGKTYTVGLIHNKNFGIKHESLEFSLNGAELSLNSVNSANSENLRNSLKHEFGSVYRSALLLVSLWSSGIISVSYTGDMGSNLTILIFDF